MPLELAHGLLGLRMIGLVWMTSGMPGVLVLRRVSSVPIVGLVGLLLVTLRCSLVGVSYGFVFVVLVAGLLVVPVPVGYIVDSLIVLSFFVNSFSCSCSALRARVPILGCNLSTGTFRTRCYAGALGEVGSLLR